MNAVLYFSGTGQSRRVAEELAARLCWDCRDLVEAYRGGAPLAFEKIAVVFPVYCQGVPSFLKPIFKRLTAEYAAIIATYGRMGAGNAIYEAARLLKAKVCAAAYLPARHSYIEGDNFVPPPLPDEVIEAIAKPKEIVLPKRRKTPFAAFAPSLRSRIGVKIVRTETCDGCGVCKQVCPAAAIFCGKLNGRCVRCLKCVHECPKKALQVKYSHMLKLYLRKKPTDEIIVYI